MKKPIYLLILAIFFSIEAYASQKTYPPEFKSIDAYLESSNDIVIGKALEAGNPPTPQYSWMAQFEVIKTLKGNLVIKDIINVSIPKRANKNQMYLLANSYNSPDRFIIRHPLGYIPLEINFSMAFIDGRPLKDQISYIFQQRYSLLNNGFYIWQKKSLKDILEKQSPGTPD